MPKIINNLHDEILRKALKHLRSKGCEHFSLRDIAKFCKIGLGTIYNYFPNKQALLTSLMHQYWVDFDNEFNNTEVSQKNIYEKLRIIYKNIEHFTDIFHDIWLNSMDLLENERKCLKGHAAVNMMGNKISDLLEKAEIQKQIKIPEKATTAVLAKFILSNFMVMAHVKILEYEQFETILKTILNK
ncbi:MAG: TetR/AcrR family transcriptional regulator [Candidatus Margulisbacteria bacterium]|nr:TetR/AcrR family transcriptional regulator [Candidatus Margulisiibacteriota bacterium]